MVNLEANGLTVSMNTTVSFLIEKSEEAVNITRPVLVVSAPSKEHWSGEIKQYNCYSMRTSKRWSEKELDILCRCYSQGGAKYACDVLKDLGYSRTLIAVKGKAFAMGIKSIKTSLFYKGMTPYNKGKRLSEEVIYKVKKTWFVKGHEPVNSKYDGHISVRKDKRGVLYKFIRIEKGKYVPLHRKVWQDHFGVIPKSHVVVFKDGNTMDCSIGNLECISKKEHLKRNQKGKHHSIELYDGFVTGVLKHLGVAAENITPEMIELKRKQLLLNRKMKNYEVKN